METRGSLNIAEKTGDNIIEYNFTNTKEDKNGKPQEKIEENPVIKQLMEIMKQQDMNKQSQEFTQILQYVVGMQIQLSAITAELHGIREQLNEMQKGQVKEKNNRVILVNEMTDFQKKNSHLLEHLSTIKNHFVDTAGKAVKAFKEKGKEGLSKVLQKGISKAKTMLGDYRKELVDTLTAYEKKADRIDRIGNEFKQIGNSVNNVGRLIAGKDTKEVSYEKPGVGFTRAINATIKKSIATTRNQIDNVDKAFEKLDKLSAKLDQSKETKKEERDSVKEKLSEMKEKAEQQKKEAEKKEPEHNREEAR